MKAIISGAAGFIGSHVAERLLFRGYEVVGMDNLSRPGNVRNLEFLQSIGDNRFHFVHGDIRNSGELDRLFRAHNDASVVVHEAAQVAVTTSVTDPRLDFEVNALGTFNILEATRAHTPKAAFLFASTNKVYGGLERLEIAESRTRYEYAECPNGIDESEPVDFHSPYGCSKGSAEQYVRDYHRIFGLKTVVFRQSCIFGTRQYGMEDQGWVAWFTIASQAGKPVTIFGDGKQVRDILWVGDLVDLYEKALENIDVAQGQIYNAGGGQANTLSLLELISMLDNLRGVPVMKSFAGWRPGDQKIFVANCGKAERELGWTPATSPATGVPKLYSWVREERERAASSDRAKAQVS